jgi:hypothetical protein
MLDKDIRKRIDVYNKTSKARGSPSSPLSEMLHSIHFDAISNPDAEIWATLEGLNPISSFSVVPFKTKRRVIDLQFMVQRCEEEIGLLKSDMQECWQYFSKQREILASAYISVDEDNDLFTLGKQSLVSQQVMDVECKLLKLHRIFSAHLSIQLPKLQVLNEDTSDIEPQTEEPSDEVYIHLPDRGDDDVYPDSEEDSISDGDNLLDVGEQGLHYVNFVE